MTVFLDTLGCAKNLVDSEKILAQLTNYGYKVVDDPSKAKIIIVNTCGFINDAREESIDTLFEYSLYKKNGQLDKLVLTGCLADMNENELKENFSEVDEVVKIKNFTKFLKSLKKNVIQKNANNVKTRHLLTPSGQAYLKIADGCSQACSFCTIPSFKGPFKSVEQNLLISEAKELANNGVKEINLVAQDLTSYGVDIGTSLKNLLLELIKIKNIKWIRLLYTYPDKIDDELIETIANEDKICNYLDLPLQHLDNNVLKKMCRWGSYEKYKELINKLRKKIPDICLRTTIIVGFPGETEQAFENLLTRVEELTFDRLGVFEYSDELNTKAYELDNKIDDEIKTERYHALMSLQMEISEEKLNKRINNVYQVLVEEISENEIRICRSKYEAPEVDGLIFVEKSNAKKGEIINVEIISSTEYDLNAVQI